jgi:hypothetical protein
MPLIITMTARDPHVRDQSRRNAIRQLDAMAVPRFEIGAYDVAQDHMLLRFWDRAEVLKSLDWLASENLHGRNIYVRPEGIHSLTLLDDLTQDRVEAMRGTGFTPAILIETSPRNFQVWLQHGTVLNKAESTIAAKMLAAMFNADPNSADWRHFGRLAGYTNRKDKYRDPATGYFPFVRLHECSATRYPKAEEFVDQVKQHAFQIEREDRERIERWQHQFGTSHQRHAVYDINDFRRKPQYQGQGGNHRCDLAYAKYALDHGVTEAEVRAAIRTRDLSGQGNAYRQDKYIDRTITKARESLSR